MPVAHKEYDELALKIAVKFLDEPLKGKRLAKEFGLWDDLKALLSPMLLKAHARKDVNTFIEYAIPDQDGNPIEQQYFHREWQALLDENKQTMIASPRAHGKSSQAVGRALHLLGNNVNLRIKIICATDDKAKELVGLVNEHIARNPKVREIFPWLLINAVRGDAKSAFFVVRDIPQRDASVEGSGVLSAGAGGRADVLLCDDVVDYNNSIANPAKRESVYKAIQETWFKLVSHKGIIIWLCTPYHVLDATHILKRGNRFKVWWKPAIRYEPKLDKNGQAVIDEQSGEPEKVEIALWPEVWPLSLLIPLRDEDPRSFARQYMLNALSDEERTFPDEHLYRSYLPGIYRMGEKVGDDWPTFAGIDLASALGARAAYTVILTLARNPDTNRLWFKDMVRRKITFSETLQEIKNQFQKHRWSYAFVENNGYQGAVEDALIKEHIRLPVHGFVTGRNKADELSGLPGLSAALARGEFAIPSGDKDGIGAVVFEETDNSPMAVLYRELMAHPGGEFKDCIMAFWFAWRASLVGGEGLTDAWIAAIAA